MATAPARARADYDYLIKLLLIGDSGKYLCYFNIIIALKFIKLYHDIFGIVFDQTIGLVSFIWC